MVFLKIGVVAILDALMLTNAYGSAPEDPDWNPEVDFNHDYIVGVLDPILTCNYGY